MPAKSVVYSTLFATLKNVRVTTTAQGFMTIRIYFSSEKQKRPLTFRYILPEDTVKFKKLLKGLRIIGNKVEIPDYDVYKTGALYNAYVDSLKKMLPLRMKLKSVKPWRKPAVYTPLPTVRTKGTE